MTPTLPHPPEAELLNEALRIALDPVRDRASIARQLAARHGGAPIAWLASVERRALAALDGGYPLTQAMLQRFDGRADARWFADAARAAHPWLDEASVAALHARGLYLAYRDG